MDKISTIIDKLRDLSSITVIGEITSKEVIREIKAYYQKDYTRKMLWDFSKASLEKIKSEDIFQIVKWSKQYSHLRKNGKTALVAHSDVGFGLGRMYDIIAESEMLEVEYMIFRDKQSALKWLFPDSPDNE